VIFAVEYCNRNVLFASSDGAAKDKAAKGGGEYVIVEAHLADRQDDPTFSVTKADGGKGGKSTKLDSAPRGESKDAAPTLLGRVLVHTDVSRPRLAGNS
jgi:hypothetical protein